MSMNLKNTPLLISLLLLMLSCNKKTQNPDDVFFLIEAFHSNRDSTLKVLLINNSHENYFFTMDTNRTYDYTNFTPAFNNSIILKPIILNGRDTVQLRGVNIPMKKIEGASNDEFGQKETQKSEAFYKKYIALENAIFLKAKSSKYFEIPFQLKYRSGIWNYNYEVEYGENYELQLEYQMRKGVTEENVPKSRLDSAKNLNCEPYYKKVLSNKVTLFTYKKPIKRRLPKI